MVIISIFKWKKIDTREEHQILRRRKSFESGTWHLDFGGPNQRFHMLNLKKRSFRND